MADVLPTPNPLDGRVIEPADFVADTRAFVDVRIPRSVGKASYSFIGPGVSQNAAQSINLTVPHGFNIGAASMPHGVVNNPHLHFTAEVFICTRGAFRMTIGEHSDQSIDLEPGTVFSAPTWVFRGFENIGPDDGWMFVALGGDDTGGIIWAPHVLEEAAGTGLYLDAHNEVLDATAGDDISAARAPLASDALAGVDQYSDDEIASRAVRSDELEWSDRALLSAVLPGHGSRMAPVIGSGITQDRGQLPPVTNPHTFSLEWLELDPGASTGRHRIGESQVLLLVEGDWRVEVGAAHATPATGSVVSVPEGEWRDLVNTGSAPARAVVISGSDAPNRIEWSTDVLDACARAGWGLDAGGYVASLALIGGRT